MKMRVAHVAQRVQGGIGTYLSHALRHQADHFGRTAICVICPEEEIRFLDPDVRDMAIPAKGWSRRPDVFLRFASNALSIIRSRQPQILHLHSTFAGLFRLFPARFMGERSPAIVYCSHGWSFDMDVSAAARGSYILAERIASKSTDCIACISEYEKERATSVGLPVEKLELVRNGVEIPDQPAAPNISDSATVRLLFVGRAAPQKGLDIAVEVMRSLSGLPIHLDVAGATYDDLDLNGRPENVSFHGWVEPGKRAELLARSHALLMPSRWEGFGLAAVEAMAMGRPVIAFAAGALPEVVGDTGILVPAGDQAALREAIARLEVRDLVERGQRARTRARSLFSTDQMNRRLVEVYELAMERRFPLSAHRDAPRSDPN